MSATVEASELHRLTGGEYHRLIEAGGFEEETRVELIHGLLCDMSPRGREHELVIEYLNRELARRLDHDRYRLRPVAALSLGDSEPEPDFAVVRRGTPEPYHPSSAELVIEVAASSQRRDLIVKPPIYAAACVTEYWVVDLRREAVFVHRDPAPEGYRSIAELRRGDALDGGVVQIGELTVAAVLGAADPH